jgi:hypothetical protein
MLTLADNDLLGVTFGSQDTGHCDSRPGGSSCGEKGATGDGCGFFHDDTIYLGV